MLKKIKTILVCLFIALAVVSCARQALTFVDAKIATNIDEKLMPVQIASTFPSGTKQVFCWFKWENATVGTKVTARWHFVTDNIHILNYEFTIPRKEGSGGVSISMPEGKQLPEGTYRVDLMAGTTKLKTLTFKVE
jgi:hypothetical protein